MIYGYARVSTDDQDLSMQLDALNGVKGMARIFQEKISGTKTKRSQLDEMLALLAKGDKVIVLKLDRLGRSVRHLIDLVRWFEEQGVEFQSMRENIDTSTSAGKLIFHIFASFAQFERDIISDRTKAGLAARVKRGVRLGRPKVIDEKAWTLARAMRKQGKGLTKISRRCGISTSQLSRVFIKEKYAKKGVENFTGVSKL